ncbi:alcohol dehydrogenase catalytic domain-containing protein [Kosakonia sp. BK9b]|uniref:zinc-dependent alcohol dehydrogenase n=1 Tax=Kosakonia sp. TaxID=1916651 RepID=UPI0028985BC0|nr:alcohol dehydrogenase catalytic domain-containing protein [Kosakonia sp.]
MKAIALTEKYALEMIDYHPMDEFPDDGVEIDIVLSGICGTDLAVLSGREEGLPGIIRGHEAVGVVLYVGKQVSDLRPGMRVVIDPNEYCGSCMPCRASQTHLCTGGKNHSLNIAGVNKHGVFAERFITRAQFVYPLPEGMCWETGVAIEPVACILNNIEQAAIKTGEEVLIIGAGPMSLVAQLLLRRMGVHVIATELNPNRAQFGQSLGLDIVSPEELAMERQCHAGFDVIIDTVGNQLGTATQYIRKGGRILLFGFNSQYIYPLPVKHFLVNSIRLIGAGEYNQHFPRALQIADTIPDLGKLVTHYYALEDYSQAFSRLLNDPAADIVKGVFMPNPKYL